LDCCSFTVDPLGSRRIRPFSATMGSSDSRTATFAQCGSLRFLGFSFPARRLHPHPEEPAACVLVSLRWQTSASPEAWSLLLA
jgi:hypothetical protein